MEYLGIPRYQEFSKVFELLNKNSDMQISIGGGKSALPLLEGSPQRFLVCAIPYSIKWPDLRRESDGKQENIEQWVVADSRQTCSSLFEGKEKFPFLFSSRKFPRALAATGEKMNRVGPIVVRLPNFPVGPKTFQFNMTVRLVTSVHVFPPPPPLKKENSLISRRIIKNRIEIERRNSKTFRDHKIRIERKKIGEDRVWKSRRVQSVSRFFRNRPIDWFHANKNSSTNFLWLWNSNAPRSMGIFIFDGGINTE